MKSTHAPVRDLEYSEARNLTFSPPKNICNLVEGQPTTGNLSRRPEPRCADSQDTHELAYFLRHTGPDLQPGSREICPKKSANTTRSAISLIKRRYRHSYLSLCRRSPGYVLQITSAVYATHDSTLHSPEFHSPELIITLCWQTISNTLTLF